MTQTIVLATWLTGALAMLAWLIVNEWPTAREDAREAGLPDHAAFIVAGFALTALVWFALPFIRLAERAQR